MDPQEQEYELVQIQPVDGRVMMAQEAALIDRQIATAKAFPRNITKATESCVAIVSLDKETATTCHYSVPRGGKSISGPSVHLAKIVAQQWGNLRIQTRVIDVDAKHVTSQATCFDLENNIAIQVEVKRSIMTKNGRMSDDMITVTGNAANSIALRNAVYAVVPRAVIDKVYNAAKRMITGDVSDADKLLVRRKQVIDRCKDAYNVTEAEVLSAIGKASVNNVTPDDLITLIGIGTAINDGDTTVDEAFRKKNTSKANVADDILTKKPEAKTEAPAAESSAILSETVKTGIIGIQDADALVTYANNLTHLHQNGEFIALVSNHLAKLSKKKAPTLKLIF